MGTVRPRAFALVGRMVALAAIVLVGASALAAAPRWELRVCADPNNLPYSNRSLEGFENRIAKIIADELQAQLTYEWWPQRRGFIGETLREGRCDVVMGVPDQFPMVLTTQPYYRSGYVFVYRADRNLTIRSLDDPVLKNLRIGVQVIGDDYANSPPAHALANRGIFNVVGYSVYGDYSSPAPLSPIMEAVVKGDVDVAIVWGPIAGYFAKRQQVPLRLVPVTPEFEPPFQPMVFSISMAVRQGDEALVKQLDQAIEKRWADIQAVLREYGVPVLPLPGAPTTAAPPKAGWLQALLGLFDGRARAAGQAPQGGGSAAAEDRQGKPKKLNPYTGNPQAIEEGMKLFRKWGCFGCHGTQAGGGMGPSLVDTQWRYGGDDASVFETIQKGRPGGMPAWGDKLSDDEIWKIIAWLRSMYKGDPGAVDW